MNKSKAICITELRQLQDEIKDLFGKNLKTLLSLKKYNFPEFNTILSNLNKENESFCFLTLDELKKHPFGKLEALKTDYFDKIDRLLNQDRKYQQMDLKFSVINDSKISKAKPPRACCRSDRLINDVIQTAHKPKPEKQLNESFREDIKLLNNRILKSRFSFHNQQKPPELNDTPSKAETKKKLIELRSSSDLSVSESFLKFSKSNKKNLEIQIMNDENNDDHVFSLEKKKILMKEKTYQSPEIRDFCQNSIKKCSNAKNEKRQASVWNYILELQETIIENNKRLSNFEKETKNLENELNNKNFLLEKLMKQKNTLSENEGMKRLFPTLDSKKCLELIKAQRKIGGLDQYMEEKERLKEEQERLMDELERMKNGKRNEIEQCETNFSMEREKLEIEKTLLEIEKNKLKDEREELNHLRDLFQLKESLKF